MKFGRKKVQSNYLDKIPVRADLAWSTDEAGIVTLHKENTGLFNRAAQKLLHKPKTSHIHLDEMGSFVWPLIDGKKTVGELAELAAQQFGNKADPAYLRMAKYIQILSSYEFVTLTDQSGRPAAR